MEKKKKKLDSQSRRLEFHYEKSPSYRVIRVDGSWGGVTPRLDLQMSIFSERIQFPDMDEVEIAEEGHTGKLTKQIFRKKGIVREIEATLLMSPETAKSLAKWLIEHIERLEAAIADDNNNGEPQAGVAAE